jgi:EAL domain-containing protein (putative c-di-GMP-specific phosphodiesterase class I)
MDHAKAHGSNNYQLYTESLKAAVFERTGMENSLRHAMERGEFLVYYQPQVDSNTGKVVGLEALLRWRHQDFGIVTPERFIPLAEESGLILPLGEWVLREACLQAAVWQDLGLLNGRVAVNLSAGQFRQPRLEEKVASILEETGFGGSSLELEITESILMQDAAAAATTLWALRNMGVHIAVDDFGTGYYSLSYLKRFQIDKLKIDRSFIGDVGENADARAIAEIVINLAHTLKLKAIAEGVETAVQLELLRSLGCDEIQGYYIARPLPATAAEEFLRRSRDAGRAVRWEQPA